MDSAAFLTILVPVIVAIISSATAAWIARRSAKRDVAASINDAMNDFIDQLQEERTQQRELLSEERKDPAKTRRTMVAMRNYIAALEKMIRDAGVTLPPHEFFWRATNVGRRV